VSLRWLLISFVAVGCAWAGEPEKPRCNAQHRGELWPATATPGSDQSLQMCTLDVWKYRWEPVTVSVSQLSKERKREKASKANEASRR
jgi:hypothetical protein